MSTGTLDLGITCSPPTDNENSSWPAPPTLVDPFEQYPKANPLKDVASTIVADTSDPHNFLLSVGNTYPGYMLDCEYHGQNIGTVPVHVEDIEIHVIRVEDSISTDLGTGTCSGGLCTFGNKGVDPPLPSGLPTWSEVYVQVHNDEGCQLHTDDEVNASWFVGVNQTAHENSTYQISVKFNFHQWNESDWNSCGVPRVLSGP